MIRFVFVDVVGCSSWEAGETVWSKARSVFVKDLGMDELACANAPLPSLKYILSKYKQLKDVN